MKFFYNKKIRIWFLTLSLICKISGWRDSNPQQSAWKAGTLANWVTPAYSDDTIYIPYINFKLFWLGLAGLEPATKRLWVFCSNQLSYRPLNLALKNLNGGPAREDVEQLKVWLEKSPLQRIIHWIRLYRKLNKDFKDKRDLLLTYKEKNMYDW